MAAVESPVSQEEAISQTREGAHLPIREGYTFHFLRKIRALDNVYPFSLRGQAYLKSSWKRRMDLILGGAALVFTSPIIGLGALAAKAESPDLTALIKQKRWVREGQTFDMYKIRSMRDNLEPTGEIRPTSVGKILRVLSIDELPQLINILRGEMSLVGRRPILPVHLRNLQHQMETELPFKRAMVRFGFTEEEWRARILSPEDQGQIRVYADEARVIALDRLQKFMTEGEGKPGITGLYRIMGGRVAPDYYRVRLDNFYEEHASLGLDLAILAATLPVVLSRRGAF